MPRIELLTEIDAPHGRVFDLARSIDLHTESMNRSKEYAAAGVTSGLIGEGESVTWEARHIGIWFSLESKIVEWDPPHHFRDSMVCGPFRHMDHDHIFEASGSATIMRDVFDFSSPLGLLGKVVDRLVLARYMRKILSERNDVIKQVAESETWRRDSPG